VESLPETSELAGGYGCFLLARGSGSRDGLVVALGAGRVSRQFFEVVVVVAGLFLKLGDLDEQLLRLEFGESRGLSEGRGLLQLVGLPDLAALEPLHVITMKPRDGENISTDHFLELLGLFSPRLTL
jgi:hypothetical protein